MSEAKKEKERKEKKKKDEKEKSRDKDKKAKPAPKADSDGEADSPESSPTEVAPSAFPSQPAVDPASAAATATQLEQQDQLIKQLREENDLLNKRVSMIEEVLRRFFTSIGIKHPTRANGLDMVTSLVATLNPMFVPRDQQAQQPTTQAAPPSPATATAQTAGTPFAVAPQLPPAQMAAVQQQWTRVNAATGPQDSTDPWLKTSSGSGTSPAHSSSKKNPVSRFVFGGIDQFWDELDIQKAKLTKKDKSSSASKKAPKTYSGGQPPTMNPTAGQNVLSLLPPQQQPPPQSLQPPAAAPASQSIYGQPPATFVHSPLPPQPPQNLSTYGNPPQNLSTYGNPPSNLSSYGNPPSNLSNYGGNPPQMTLPSQQFSNLPSVPFYPGLGSGAMQATGSFHPPAGSISMGLDSGSYHGSGFGYPPMSTPQFL